MFQANMFEGHHMFDMASKSSENDSSKLKDDDYETKSGTETMEAQSGDDQDPSEQHPKKKRYHRHTQRQIQDMEA
jgi:homeobox-leucine zipper protein